MDGCLSMRPREAARALGVSERTLFSLIKRGEIRAVKLSAAKSGAVLIPRAELEKFLNSRMGGEA